MKFFGSKEIKEVVARVLQQTQSTLAQASVLDFPAGNGVTTQLLLDLGAQVTPVDLFPEFFRVQHLVPEKWDLGAKFPWRDQTFDYAVCQEGIEHVGNQDAVFSEFARVLKPGGRLLLTTPNYSNLKSKLSYLLTESESFGRIMPPNEVDSVWLSHSTHSEIPNRVYFGHCFLTGFFRLRLFAQLSGLDLVKIHDSRVNSTSLLLFPLIYPLIVLSSLRTALHFKSKRPEQKQLAWTLFRQMIDPKILLENHLVLEFRKSSAFKKEAEVNKSETHNNSSELAAFTT